VPPEIISASAISFAASTIPSMSAPEKCGVACAIAVGSMPSRGTPSSLSSTIRERAVRSGGVTKAYRVKRPGRFIVAASADYRELRRLDAQGRIAHALERRVRRKARLAPRANNLRAPTRRRCSIRKWGCATVRRASSGPDCCMR
jgi:hypothetical protein